MGNLTCRSWTSLIPFIMPERFLVFQRKSTVALSSFTVLVGDFLTFGPAACCDGIVLIGYLSLWSPSKSWSMWGSLNFQIEKMHGQLTDRCSSNQRGPWQNDNVWCQIFRSCGAISNARPRSMPIPSICVKVAFSVIKLGGLATTSKPNAWVIWLLKPHLWFSLHQPPGDNREISCLRPCQLLMGMRLVISLQVDWHYPHNDIIPQRMILWGITSDRGIANFAKRSYTCKRTCFLAKSIQSSFFSLNQENSPSVMMISFNHSCKFFELWTNFGTSIAYISIFYWKFSESFADSYVYSQLTKP